VPGETGSLSAAVSELLRDVTRECFAARLFPWLYALRPERAPARGAARPARSMAQHVALFFCERGAAPRVDDGVGGGAAAAAAAGGGAAAAGGAGEDSDAGPGEGGGAPAEAALVWAVAARDPTPEEAADTAAMAGVPPFVPSAGDDPELEDTWGAYFEAFARDVLDDASAADVEHGVWDGARGEALLAGLRGVHEREGAGLGPLTDVGVAGGGADGGGGGGGRVDDPRQCLISELQALAGGASAAVRDALRLPRRAYALMLRCELLVAAIASTEYHRAREGEEEEEENENEDEDGDEVA
jgi:hypothetical protein